METHYKEFSYHEFLLHAVNSLMQPSTCSTVHGTSAGSEFLI